MLASLREHFNSMLFSVSEGIPIIGPLIRAIPKGTTPGSVIDALQELGCTDCYDQTSLTSTRDLGFAMAADGHFVAGRIVVLLIDANMLTSYYGKDPGPFGVADHWVGLNSRIALTADKKRIRFRVFSWGGLLNVDIPTFAFLRLFYGYIVGKF